MIGESKVESNIDVNYIKPKVVKDLSSWLLFRKKNEDLYCIGSIEKDSYLEVPEHTYKSVLLAIKSFNGEHTLNEIQNSLLNNDHILLDTVKLYNILCKAGLIDNIDDSLREKQELEILSFKLLEVSISPIVNLLALLLKVIFPYGIIVSLPIILFGLTNLVSSAMLFIEPISYTVNESYLLGLFISLFAFSISLGFHELSHMLIAYKYGLIPSKLTISLYLGFIPMIYLRIPGIYTIEPIKRIKIWVSGVYMNLVMASISLLLTYLVPQYLFNIFFLVTLVNLSMIIANLSPFMPLDGYFILSTLLKKPNLRKGAFKEFKRFVFRENNEFKGITILYFIISILFMILICATQIIWVTRKIVSSFSVNHNLFQVILDLKFIFIILAFIVIKSIATKVVKERIVIKKSLSTKG